MASYQNMNCCKRNLTRTTRVDPTLTLALKKELSFDNIAPLQQKKKMEQKIWGKILRKKGPPKQLATCANWSALCRIPNVTFVTDPLPLATCIWLLREKIVTKLLGILGKLGYVSIIGKYNTMYLF